MILRTALPGASRPRALWWRLRDSLWLVPAALVAGATLLALGLVELGGLHDLELEKRLPRLFGAGVDGSRSMLAAIATTMLTVAATVFSITLAVLSLAATQYTPRVLRTFMADRPTQVVLGFFVCVFAYCLVVLRTIRGGEGEAAFVPSIAVLGAIVLAFIAVGLLVFFIHHLAVSIEAATILARVTRGAREAVEDLFPEQLGEEAEAAAEPGPEAGAWRAVAAERSGYIVSVDNAALLDCARRHGRVVRMELAIGDFAIAGQPLAALEGDAAVDEDARARLNRCYSLEEERTIQQDAAFGLQQMVDIGLRALSPGANDQSTAIACIDRLTEVLVVLAGRRVESPARRDAEGLRVIARGPTFAGLVALAFEDLREAGGGKPTVLARLLDGIERIAAATANPGRREVLAGQARRVLECARRGVHAPHALDALVGRGERLLRALP